MVRAGPVALACVGARARCGGDATPPSRVHPTSRHAGDGKINYPEWNKVMIDSTTRMVRGEKKTGGGGRKLPFIN